MNTFEIGPGLSCDLDLLIASRLLVQASSGQGKTRTIRRLLEQTHGKVQHLVVDPEGEYHTLREKFDYVLAAPKGGDVVAHPKHAALLAHKLLELGVSAILDIFELNPKDRVLFVRRFFEALVDAPRSLWHPCLIVLDEGHVFAPEKGDAESAESVEALSSRGRKRAFCLVIATQRLAKLKKDVAAELQNKLIGGCNLDLDIDRGGEELGFSKPDRKVLRTLDPGQFYAFGRAFHLKAPALVKVGTVSTSHPEPGQQAAPTPPPTAKVRAVLEKLSALPAEAEEREKSLDTLKKENANLRRELTIERSVVKGTGYKQVEVEKRVEVPVVLDASLARAESLFARAESLILGFAESDRKRVDLISQRILAVAVDLRDVKDKIQAAVAPAIAAKVGTGGSGPQQPLSSARATAVSSRPVARPPARSNAIVDGSPLTGPEQRILDAIAWMASIGVDEPEQTAVAFLAGYTFGGGAFMNPRGRLNSRGFVEYRADRIRLTDEGAKYANTPDTPLTSTELHERILARLPGPERKILTRLLEAYPKVLSDEDLAEATNYTAGGGAFNNPKGRLRSLGLIDYPQPRHAQAREILFLD